MTAIDDFLERASRINWFSNSGQSLPSHGPMEIETARSWKAALDKSGSIAIANAWEEGRALITVELGLNHKLEYRKWNDHVAMGHYQMEETVFAKADAVIDSMPEIAADDECVPFLKGQVRWDMVAAYMEQVYSHLVPPRFYTLLFEVYEAGHYPCGWNEVWPNGKLWVY